MLQFGVWLIVNLFDLFIYRKYLEVFVGRRVTSTECSICLLFLCAIIRSVTSMLHYNVLNLSVSILVLILYIMQYKVAFRTRVVAVIVFLGITFITEPIGYLIHILLMGEVIHEPKISYFFLAFLFELVRMVIVEIFCFLKRGKKIQVFGIPKEILYILHVIPATSIISCILIIEMAKNIVNPEILLLCMTIIFTIIISNYLMFSMVHRHVELAENQREAELLYQESMLKEEYYRNMDQSIERIHDLKHDMKNQLIGLVDLMAEGENQVAKQKLQSMVAEVTEATAQTYSQNPVINSILKIKIAEAKRQDIKVRVEALVPKRMNIEIGDYGVLYGNLLDNAIEACMKIVPADRYISIKTKYQEGILLLVIQNSKDDILNTEFKTTKRDKRKHGRGIRSVRKVSEKYAGELVLKDNGTEFEANLLLTGIEAME